MQKVSGTGGGVDADDTWGHACSEGMMLGGAVLSGIAGDGSGMAAWLCERPRWDNVRDSKLHDTKSMWE